MLQPNYDSTLDQERKPANTNIDGSWITRSLQKVNKSLEQIFQPNDWFSYQIEIRLATSKEVANEIKESVNPSKVSEFDLINETIIKQLHRKAIVI